ncbi:MAG TPA: hypothetical protein VEL76_07140 [Gemmataceae bacterium]|nr:hypothetical protein [Gemmataceae bacterium]
MLAKEPDNPDPKSPESLPAAPAAPESQKPARKPIDEKTIALLRQAAKRRRPWTRLTWLIVLLCCAIPLGLGAWVFWPRSPPLALVVIAFDEVVVQGETASSRGQLVPVEADRAGVRLEGYELTFEEQPFGALIGRQPVRRLAKTTAEGSASVEWGFAAVGRFDFLVRYVRPDRESEAVDRGRVFAWPKETKLLLVDVAALTEKGEKLWADERVPNAVVLPDASTTLQTAQKAKWAVVYLALPATRGTIYRQVRNWTTRHTLPPNGVLPDGPALGRLSVSGGGSDGILALLKRFDGPPVVIVGQAEAGEPYRAAGIRTLAIGPGGQDWKAAAQELAK